MNIVASTLTSSGHVDAPACPRLDGRLVARAQLTDGARHAMFALLASHFAGVDRSTFDADLADKNWVILLEDEERRLRGFSTLLIYHTEAAGVPATVVYSGDTIVDHGWWGSPALPRSWIHAVRRLAPMESGGDLYWLLLTSGYRTYRFLPVFYRRFYPRHNEPTPPAMQCLMRALARERFGGAYDPSDGIVRFPRPQILKRDLLDVPDGRREDPHVAFFLTTNPGFARGDELLCLTRVHDDNLTPAAHRMLR